MFTLPTFSCGSLWFRHIFTDKDYIKLYIDLIKAFLKDIFPVLFGSEVLSLTNLWIQRVDLISYKTRAVYQLLLPFPPMQLFILIQLPASALLITDSCDACLVFPSAQHLQLSTGLLLSQHCACIPARTMNNSIFLRNYPLYLFPYTPLISIQTNRCDYPFSKHGLQNKLKHLLKLTLMSSV